MKHYLTPLLLLIPAGILSYVYSLISFLLLAVIAFCLAVLLVVGIAKAFLPNLPQKWVRLPLLITAVCVAGVLIGLLRPLDPAVINSGDTSDKLAYAYESDQADRMTIAAFVFHHSKRSGLLEIAQKLAGEVAAISDLKDDYVVQWLARATYHRWMVSLGKTEKYDTQDKFSISVE